MQSNRRTAADRSAATQAPKTAAAAALAVARGRVKAGNATPTDERLIADAEGRRLGVLMQQRRTALDVVTTAQALGLRADHPTGWLMPPTDQAIVDAKIAGTDPEREDARAILAAVPTVRVKRDAKTGRPVLNPDGTPVVLSGNPNAAAYLPPTYRDRDRMPAGTLLALAAQAAKKVGATPGMDRDEIAGTLALATLEGSADERPSCYRCGGPARYGWGVTDDYGERLTLAACIRHARGRREARTLPAVNLPRWDAPSTVDPEMSPGVKRDKWRGYLVGIARNVAALEGRRHGGNVSADWTPTGEDEQPTPEQRAAQLAERAAADVAAAVEATDPSTLAALAATAPGSAALSAAESDALLMALAGVTRAQLAAMRGVDSDSVKKGAQRGRKALAARVPDERTARQWARAAAAEDRDDHDRAAALLRDRATLLAPPLPLYRGAALSWPDRTADPTADGDSPDDYGPRWPVGVTHPDPAYQPERHAPFTAPQLPSWQAPHSRAWFRILAPSTARGAFFTTSGGTCPVGATRPAQHAPAPTWPDSFTPARRPYGLANYGAQLAAAADYRRWLAEESDRWRKLAAAPLCDEWIAERRAQLADRLAALA